MSISKYQFCVDENHKDVSKRVSKDEKQSNGMLQIKSGVQCVRSWGWVKG